MEYFDYFDQEKFTMTVTKVKNNFQNYKNY